MESLTTSRNEIFSLYNSSKYKDTPLRETSILNILTQWYSNKLISDPKLHPFDFDKMFKLDAEFDLNKTYPDFKEYLEGRIRDKKKSFMGAMFGFFWKDYFMGSGPMSFLYILQVFFPIAFRLYMNWLSDPDSPPMLGLLYMVLMLFLVISRPVCLYGCFYNNIKTTLLF